MRHPLSRFDASPWFLAKALHSPDGLYLTKRSQNNAGRYGGMRPLHRMISLLVSKFDKGSLVIRRRPTTRAERRNAFDIFRDSIDYDAVVISRGSPFALVTATTIGNTINLVDGI